MAMVPPIVVTEDTPPDMLAGSMDLSVVLPNGHSLKMSIDRSTPMMDLLVQVTTGNKMSPAGYTLQPLNEQGPLPYKPSTPIGALDAWTIHVVPKHSVQGSGNKNSCKSLNQPFEQTFRLQVHLPRNQLFVARVSPRTKLSEILHQVCVEKNLDPVKYSLRHPNNLDLVLRLPCSLADYKLQEVTLVCNQSHPVEVSVSTVDIMSLQRDSSNPAYRNTLCEGSVSSGSLEGRSLSPAPSDESSASPPPLPPSRPTRKRRPAPKPPIATQKSAVTIKEKPQNGVQSSTVINHSRNSSDSSGYHEASVLSDSPQNNNVSESLGQHKTTRVVEAVPLSKSMTDVTMIEPTLKQAISSNSISSLSSNPTRKKKAAPPPPPNANIQASAVPEDRQKTSSTSSTASSTTTLDGNEANAGVKSATLPPSSRLNSVTKGMSPPPSPSLPPTTKVDIEPPLSRQDPPAPRPRSRLMEQDGESDLYLRSKLPSPKKTPAPQPRPRTLISSSLLSVEGDLNKPNDAGQVDSSSQKQPVLLTQTMPSALMKTHKACIEELAFKFVRQNSVDSDSDPVDNQKEEQERNIDCVNNAEPLVPDHVTTDERDGRCTILPVESQADTSAEATAWVVESPPEAESSSSDLRIADEEIDRIFTHATRNHSDSPELVKDEDKLMSLCTLPSPPTSLPHCETKPSSQGEEALDWEYKLPAPPTFRDDTRSPSVTDFGTVTIANLSDIAGVKPLELGKSLNKTDLEKIIESEIRTKESNVEDFLKLKTVDSDENTTRESKVSGIPTRVLGNNQTQPPKIKKQYPLIELKNEGSKCLGSEEHSVKLVTNRIINNNHRWSIADLTSLEKKQYNNSINSSSTLENFTISTYKDTKPFEVFEDDSIKSSVGEKRDRSKDDAVFRAPKARVKEPNLSRTNSFSVEGKANGPMIKRSVSYVSLLAANMPRNSQPYLAHLRHQETPWQRLRKTSSELNIDDQDGKTNEKSLWDNDSTQFESVKILRNILSQSQANLTSPRDQVEEVFHKQQRGPSTSVEKLEDIFSVNSSDNKWSRRQSEEASGKSNQWTPSGKIQHSVSLDEEETKATDNIQRGGGPAVNFSTWSERPKRQFSIKNDNDYISGFGKKSIINQDEDSTESLRRDSQSTTTKVQTLNSALCASMISKNASLRLEERSKSTSDLSRIPIVRAVEFKKPFAVNSYDRSSLKPVQILDDLHKVAIQNQEKTNLDDFNNNDDENFLGVDSLARRFGVPQKRPPSQYVNSQGKDNTQTDIKGSVKLLRSLSSVNSVFSKMDLTTSDVKALAKTKSGGLVVDSLPGEEDSHLNNKNHTSVESFLDKSEERISAINFPVIQNTELNSSSTINGVKSSQGSSVGALTSSVYVKHTPAQTRPVSLQPVVKGFRLDSQAQTSTTSSTKTKDFRSTSVVNSNSLSHKGTFQRTMSAPVDPTPPTIVKEKVKVPSAGITKVSSVPLFTVPNIREDSVNAPPPPPMMPILRPVSERRNIKLLPPPEAKPRDQLMLSIRSFSVDNLRKVSK